MSLTDVELRILVELLVPEFRDKESREYWLNLSFPNDPKIRNKFSLDTHDPNQFTVKLIMNLYEEANRHLLKLLQVIAQTKTGSDLSRSLNSYITRLALSEAGEPLLVNTPNEPLTSNPLEGNSAKAQEYFKRGIEFELQHDFDATLACLSLAITANPFFAAAHNNMGNLLGKNFANKEAIKAYSLAIAIDSNFSEAYNNRGVERSKSDDKQGAMADYDRAIKLNPELAQAYLNRGVLLVELDLFEEAMTNYEKAIQLNETISIAYSNRGNLHIIQGKLTKGIADYDRAIELDNRNFHSFTARGIAYHLNHDLEHALDDLTEAIHLNPKSALAFRSRGNVYADQGKNHLALLDFAEAMQLEAK